MSDPPAPSRSAQVRDGLLEAIHGGHFPDGRLPPEKELAAELGVSRTTLRSALAGLEDDGLITRRRRHGTVVNQHLLRTAMRLNRLVAFTTLIEQCGHVASVDPQRHTEAPADAEIAETLGIPEGTPCLVVDRLLRAGEAPVITVQDTVPKERFGEEIVPGTSTFAFLAANGLPVVDYAATDLVPRVATNAEPAGLELPPGTPYLGLRETHYSAEHEPIALSRIAVDDRLVRLSLLRRS